MSNAKEIKKIDLKKKIEVLFFGLKKERMYEFEQMEIKLGKSRAGIIYEKPWEYFFSMHKKVAPDKYSQ